MAESGKTLVRDTRATVNAVSTRVVDVMPLVAFHMLEYTISFSCVAPWRTKVLKLLVRKTETSLATQVFGKSGDPINIAIDAFENAANLELRVSNNENFAVDFVAARTII